MSNPVRRAWCAWTREALFSEVGYRIAGACGMKFLAYCIPDKRQGIAWALCDHPSLPEADPAALPAMFLHFDPDPDAPGRLLVRATPYAGPYEAPGVRP